MNDRGRRASGAGLLALMVVHVARSPEGGWVLLSGCDAAALATAIGLLGNWPRINGVAFLFQAVVGLPALLVGVLTTWVPGFTSVGIHLLPLGLGGMSVARNGLPRHAALVAFSGYALLLVLSFVLSPPALNINLVHTVWPPIAHLFSHRATYHIAFLAAVLAVLAVGEWTIRKLVPTQTAASNQLDTNSIDDVPSM